MDDATLAWDVRRQNLNPNKRPDQTSNQQQQQQMQQSASPVK